MEHTDLYKINLKSLPIGKHDFTYALGDGYFQSADSSLISAGEVSVEVSVVHATGVYTVELSYDGYVVVPCDRCLEDMEEDVYTEREFIVKLGDEYNDDSDEVLILPEREGVLDLSWIMYEDIALSLPMQLLHEDGACDPEMTNIYERIGGAPQEDQPPKEDGDVDPRWAALKQLKK